MRKVIYGICAAAFIVTAAINVNISLKSEKKAKLKLTNVLALANNENPNNGENGNDPPPPTCSASANCYLGGTFTPDDVYATISCKGYEKCEAGIQKVVCDGIEAKCIK